MKLSEILAEKSRQKFATEHGTEIHRRLQFVFLDGSNAHGDSDLVEKIRKNPEIVSFFDKNSRAEVPIAGYVNGKFVSRRIDRLKITPEVIKFLDYKTDTDKTAFRDKYIAQIKEYTTLLHAAYPNHTIHGSILWTHDWELEKII
ncbi:MAG: hypothetical protein FWE50_04785 [Alphaproteobacteria bacterium]|nr:hypothetical protein [Alphaproteobacteria bacterium]